MWFVSLKNEPCHVVYTELRPVPLIHYCFPSGADGLYLVVDENNHFKDSNFKAVMAKLHEEGSNHKKTQQSEANSKDIIKLVKLI